MNSLWLSNNKLINNNFIKEIDTSNTSNKTLLETDVCIIGAGIFGLTCAYYLSNLGYRVTVLEKDKNRRKNNWSYYRKITSQHGLFYSYLANSYSQKFAQDYLEANEQAIKNIKNIIDKEKIKCDFEYKIVMYIQQKKKI